MHNLLVLLSPVHGLYTRVFLRKKILKRRRKKRKERDTNVHASADFVGSVYTILYIRGEGINKLFTKSNKLCKQTLGSYHGADNRRN